MQKIPNSLIKGNSGLYDSAFISTAGTPVLYVAHRNNPNILPEHTMEGYRACVQAGVKAIEQDVYALKDGTDIIMHDSTIDRTTTGSGSTSEQTSLSVAAMRNDHGSTIGGAFSGKTFGVPTFEDVVKEFGGKVLLVPEGKNAGSVQRIVDVLQKYDVPGDGAIVQSFDYTELAPAIAAGYKTMALGNSIDVSAAAAAGVDIICGSTAASDAYITSITAAGMRAGIYTINRQYERDAWIAKGVTCFFSNDSIYLSGVGYRLTTDPFESGAYYHGHLADGASNEKGTFTGDSLLLTPTAMDRNLLLQGWASPVGGDKNNNSFTVQFSFQATALTGNRWCGIAIFNKDTPWDDNANPTTDQDGWHCLIRTEGTIEIYKVTDGVGTQVATGATAALATNTTYTMTLTVTPTTITWQRSGYTAVSASDSAYRGGYIYLTDRTNPTKFFNVTVTDN